MTEQKQAELEDLNIEEQEDTQQGKYLTFSLGSEEYGIDISDVREIVKIQKITDVPDMPHYIKGVINLRGLIIPVMDVRIRFGIDPMEYNERTSIIVVNIREKMVGLIVDTVSEVMDIQADMIESAGGLETTSEERYIKAFGKVEGAVKILLDIQNLIFGDEFEEISKAS